MQNRTASMPINIERPRSALLRGVHITEFKGHIINPDPIILQETDLLLEEFLSPTKLKALTGVNDLKSVEHLEMIVDTSETSLGNFGIYLPNLKQLKLNGSHVPRIRDLGTSLIHLRVLWLSRSGLTDLDGISTLNNLEELYLAYNEITDLSPCSLLDNLKCLDLEGNLIDDLKQVEFLNLCSNLENLTLDGNPICIKPFPEANENDIYSYRHEIIKILPSLQILDDELTLNTKSLPSAKSNLKTSDNYNQPCPFDDDWQLINELIDEGIGPPEEKLAINESLRPNSSSSHGSRTSTSVRPISAMRPLSSYRIKTAFQTRPKSRLTTSSSSGLSTAASKQSNPFQLRPNTDPMFDASNDASHLTVGPALQGNPLRALLSRKKSNITNMDSETIILNSSSRMPSYKTAMKSLTEDSATIDLKLENKELRDEIIKWRKEHTKKLEERKEYFEPQVLKIEDTDVQPLSDIEVVDEDYEYTNIKNLEFVNNNFSTMYIKNNREPEKDIATRPKSAFKKSFDYNNPNNLEIEIKDEKRRSKSRDKHKKNKEKLRSSSRTSITSLTESYVRENSATRIKTDINLSNMKNNHQPIIVSSALPSSAGSNSSSSLANMIKPISQTANSGTLKQLKSNLAPISGIKLPK